MGGKREEEGPGEEVRGTEVVVGVAQGEVGLPGFSDSLASYPGHVGVRGLGMGLVTYPGNGFVRHYNKPVQVPAQVFQGLF